MGGNVPGERVDIERILIDAIETLYADNLEILRRDVAERKSRGRG